MKGGIFITEFKKFSNSNIKFLREKKGLNQGDLSKALNIDQSTVAKWETGERQITLSWAFKLSDFFDVQIGDFLTTNLKIPKQKIENNEYDDKLKKLATENGVEISYSKNAPLTEEDFAQVSKILLEEIQKKEKK